MELIEREYYGAMERLKQSSLNIVDKSTWQDRLSICKKCKYYEMYNNNNEIFKCTKCGCPGFKFLLENSRCPLTNPKWR